MAKNYFIKGFTMIKLTLIKDLPATYNPYGNDFGDVGSGYDNGNGYYGYSIGYGGGSGDGSGSGGGNGSGNGWDNGSGYGSG